MRIIICALMVGAMLATTAGLRAENGESIVTSTCSNCHSLNRVCYNLGKDRAFWHSTVNRMITNGAPITVEQATAAADYLAGLEPGSKPVCR